ncbi:MAG TPA: cyclopropane-fatty-acyl-phospholipid synthase family protein [Aquihabitans sp.]|jgi:cyclopropane-fatty-acyl-phospholipid synthase|nr:cyclopropane-fatty-acyl-phospholipid synthase family protein [Aquihabitans sp.]
MAPSSPATGRRSVADEVAPLVGRILGRSTDHLPLAVRAWDGSRVGPPDAAVTAVLHSPRALRHLLWAPNELGLARAHVAGDLDVEGDVFDLLAVADVVTDPGEELSLRLDPAAVLALARAARRLGVLGPPPPRPREEAALRGWRHTLRRDAGAISHHYDVGNDFYRLLLGPSLTYSCAYWYDDGIDLTQAQAAKHELVCRKLGLRPGMRLLDVGCGWGSMVVHAARHHGVQAVGITISQEQAALARRRVADAGLADRVEIRVQDYRLVADGPFDAISSIGMFEHVGAARTATYLARLHELLRPGGRLLNHAISRPDPDVDAQVDPRSFIGRYVFPDAALLEVGTVVTAMSRCGFEVRDVHSLREHYARTLRAWVANLQAAWPQVQRLVGPGRARVWRLYLAASAIGFEQHRTAVHQVLAVRPHPDGRSEVTATRAGLDVTAADPPPAGSAGDDPAHRPTTRR